MFLKIQYYHIKSTNHDVRTHQLYSLTLKLLSTNRSCRFKWTPFWLLLFFKSSQQSPVLTTLSEKFMIDIACTLLVNILPVSAHGYSFTQLVLQMQGCSTLPKHFSPSCQYFCTSVISETFCNSEPYVSANSYSCNPPAPRWLLENGSTLANISSTRQQAARPYLTCTTYQPSHHHNSSSPQLFSPQISDQLGDKKPFISETNLQCSPWLTSILTSCLPDICILCCLLFVPQA